MKEKNYLIGILSFINVVMIFNFLSVALGVLFKYPETEYLSIFYLIVFIFICVFIFAIAMNLKFSTWLLIVLTLVPIVLMLLNKFLIDSLTEIDNLMAQISFYSWKSVADITLVVIILIYLFVKVLNQGKMNESEIIDQ